MLGDPGGGVEQRFARSGEAARIERRSRRGEGLDDPRADLPPGHELGVARGERIRVPLPAARTTTVTGGLMARAPRGGSPQDFAAGILTRI